VEKTASLTALRLPGAGFKIIGGSDMADGTLIRLSNLKEKCRHGQAGVAPACIFHGISRPRDAHTSFRTS